MMGGTMRAPFTALVFTLELTHDLNALPALLIGCVAAQTVTVLLLKRSILTEKIARRGHHITREYSIDHFELLRVELLERIRPWEDFASPEALAARMREDMTVAQQIVEGQR